MVKAIDQRGRAEAGWIYIFLKEKWGVWLESLFFFSRGGRIEFGKKVREGGRGF